MSSKVSRRLRQPLAKEVLEYVFLPRLNREFHANFGLLNQINFAHLLMLGEQRILDAGSVARLAAALVRIEDEGPEAVELDANREEAYFNYEAHLIQLVGADLGGRLHTARSRNDMGATIDRIRARDFVVRLGRSLNALAEAALMRAERHVDCVMPGYTGRAADHLRALSERAGRCLVARSAAPAARAGLGRRLPAGRLRARGHLV